MERRQRVGVLVEIPQVLREMRQDPATVVTSSGTNPDLLRNAENSLSFAELDALVQACVAATGCEHFGLLEKPVAAYWAIEQPSMADTVTRMLRARVIFPDTSLEAVASELSMTPGTLKSPIASGGQELPRIDQRSALRSCPPAVRGTRMDITDIVPALVGGAAKRMANQLTADQPYGKDRTRYRCKYRRRRGMVLG